VRGMTPVRFAATNSVQRGMWTIALGNPYGLAGSGEMSMSVGIVSATDRALPKLASQERRLYSNLIQTTAEINPGNSGGPLFDLEGRVIGVSTAVILPQKSTYGIGFAMPITAELLARVEDLKEGREIKYAYLGVMVSAPTVHQRRLAKIDGETGVNIDAVEMDSPAHGILKPADVVTEINGRKVSRSDQFVRMIGGSSLDAPTTLGIRREGESMSLVVNLRQRELPSVAVNRENQRIRWRGMLLGPIPAHWSFGAASRRPDHGLMVLGIDPNSPMAREGIHSGSIISSVAGRRISDITDLQEILDQTPVELCKVELSPTAVHEIASGQTP
jgi:serine protease Do